MNKSELREIVLSQQKKKLSDALIERDLFKKAISYLQNSFIIIIAGIRRVGKSTLLHQINQNHPGYYLNFDDERLVHFALEDFHTLYEVFIEIYGEKDIFYFDEIQNINGWERFVRRLHDEKKKVFVTGSNASMLSRELGTHLTGRYLEINLYPFSFNEFLKMKKWTLSPEGTSPSKIMVKKHFDEYITQGGLPEFLATQNKDYLILLFDNILYRDVMARYQITNEKTLKELVYLIAGNIAKEISFNSIKNTLKLGSSTTIKEYFGYFENSFLIFLVNKFDYSLKKQMYSSKKAYMIDTGLAVNLGFRISDDFGRLLENIVFIELKRRKKDVYFYREEKECDFVLRNGSKITEAIQVCYELNDKNREREVTGLIEAMNKFKLKDGFILTLEQTEEFVIGKKKIHVIPIFRWLSFP